MVTRYVREGCTCVGFVFSQYVPRLRVGFPFCRVSRQLATMKTRIVQLEIHFAAAADSCRRQRERSQRQSEWDWTRKYGMARAFSNGVTSYMTRPPRWPR